MRDEDNRGLSFHSPELSSILFVWPGQFVEMTRLRIEVYACLHGSLEIDVAVLCYHFDNQPFPRVCLVPSQSW